MATPTQETKDGYWFQRERLTRICNELAPGKLVEFDEASSRIKFRVRDEELRVDLTRPSGELLPSELADLSDDQLRALVWQLSSGKN